ncbi:MAG: hypothetical protein PHZ09_06370 [Eubacteriales bacterium]|nr:hypothetical protein [Eubacteriales bacterium]
MQKNEMLAYLNEREGVLNLAPVFVPRRFGSAGHRLRLHPDDYFPLGTARGSIKERWFSSVISAMNGPDAAEDEGMSYVNIDGKTRIALRDFVDTLGAALIGNYIHETYGTWPMYSKFFDYEGPLFHHLHPGFEDAARVGKNGKPEAYYYPPQMNNYPGKSPHTYFGFDPGVTRAQVRERLAGYTQRDIRITELSRAYRIELGTGWYTPPGVMHAPGSYLTYEPQWNSDVNSVFENIADGEIYGRDFLTENLPPEDRDDMDKVMALLDWDKNVDPRYRQHYFRPPLTITSNAEYTERWIAYGNHYIAAKELSVEPGQTAVIRDETAYGCIVVQGWGSLQGTDCAAAVMLRYGGLSQDEFFVSAGRAEQGLTVTNRSGCEPLVMLKHFPYHPAVPAHSEE